MDKILFLTNLIPYPLDNGGKIKTYNIIEALSKSYSIDLICFANKEIEKKYKENLLEIVNSIDVIQKTLIKSYSKKYFFIDYFKSIFSKAPYNINKYYDKRFVDILKLKLKKNHYKFIYVDHLPMMVYIKYLKGYKILLDEHNVESLIFKRIINESSNIFKKIIGSVEYAKLKLFEKKSLKYVDHVICLSETDKKFFIENFNIPMKKISVLPIHINVKENYIYEIKQIGKLTLLFLGSMSWYPNQHGIKWFIHEVWPKLDKDLFKLYIVGSNPPKDIKKYHDGKRIIVTGYVDDVDKYIIDSDISIVPIFIGSGQRVKIIESFAKKIPVISTTIGAEGLIYENGKNILIADSSNEFIKQLNDASHKPNRLKVLSKNARENFNLNYSSHLLNKKLQRIIKCMDKK